MTAAAEWEVGLTTDGHGWARIKHSSIAHLPGEVAFRRQSFSIRVHPWFNCFSKFIHAQSQRTLAENLADLPSVCNVGCKRNRQGHQESWIGFKLHLDTIDGDIPVSCILTSASVPDSQAAIPLAQMSADRVTWLYDLMDSAYDTPQIHAFSRAHGHMPIMDPNPRRGEKIPLEPAQAQRYGERSAAERVNSRLQERYGGRWVRVRGARKVMAHLMFGVIALTAQALWARLC